MILLITSNLSAFQTETENVFSDKYFDVALNEINQAKSSIFVVMYLVSIFPGETASRPAQLINALETVILGSTNWSEAALTRNNETDALIRSKEFAQSLLEDFSKIKIGETPVAPAETARVPQDFLTDGTLLGEMVTCVDERAMDVYLWCHFEAAGPRNLIR